MSRFTDELYANALSSSKGMVTGEPDAPVRHTWKQVHERAKRLAGGLAAAGLGPDDAIGMLVGLPVLLELPGVAWMSRRAPAAPCCGWERVFHPDGWTSCFCREYLALPTMREADSSRSFLMSIPADPMQ